MTRLIALTLALFALPVTMTAQEAITSRNWRTHPEIREVRAIVASIEDRLPAMTETSDSSDCGRGYTAIVAHLFADSAGLVRKYIREEGSDDSAGEESFYYDPLGTLRFTFASVGAVNGTHREDRYYYGAKGQLLYHDKRLLAGPGYSGRGDTPVVNPKEDFTALCGAPPQ
jgi:hypothetical protein